MTQPSATAIVEPNTTDAFFRVPIATLRPGSQLGFALFATVGGEPINFLGAGQKFERHHRRTLLDTDQLYAFIPSDSRAEYYQYLEGSIAALLAEDLESSEERVARAYEVGSVVTRNLMDNPSGPGARSMATEWVGHSAGLLTADNDGVLAGMVRVFDVAPSLYEHSLQVCLYGLALANALGTVEGHELEDFGIGLLLHDIGLFDVEAGWPAKPESLTAEDRAEIERHPRLGYDRVQGLNWVGSIARDVILHHHERLDGRGYPTGIAPRNLSVHARIAAIVNTFDSRTTDRPYRPARGTMDVLREMIDAGRGAYDTKILAAFVRMLSG